MFVNGFDAFGIWIFARSVLNKSWKWSWTIYASQMLFFFLATVLFSLSHVRSTDLVCQLFMFCTPIVTTDTVLLTCLRYVFLIYDVLMCPFLNVCIPSILLSHWASLSLHLFIFLYRPLSTFRHQLISRSDLVKFRQ